jgi:ATP-dependent DNA helicase RecG
VEFLPSQIIQQYNLLPFKEALWQIHFPQSLQMAQKAQNRFAFEELLITELFVLKERLKINQQKAPVIDLKLEEIKKFVQSLPFRLTDSQKKCAWQILKDMQKPHPMNRLLEGDVGSGKTVVALIAILNCIKNGYQVALMAPTEILANQHFKTAAVLLKKFKVRIALLTGKKDLLISQKISYEKDGKMLLETIEISRSKILEKTKKGEIDLLVGTHTLIQDKVKFQNLGLVIVDEQHRFGVQQRAKLNQKSDILAHFLSMTATPIPRTLALTVYGDLDLSVLDQMPSGRKPVITKIIPPQKREEAYQFITKQIEQGNQAFVICPRIEPNSPENTESLLERKNIWAEVKAVKAEYEKLAQEVFPRFKVAMMHGKMKANEKEKIMRQFQNGKIDILVSTSVVEVGIDIPKATVMIIEDADRFGLAQIHQFRGRVGRSDLQSYCFLFTNSAGKKTRERLSALLQAKNGFELAQKDLEIRGPGSLLGAKQWGLPDLAMSYLNNLQLIETVREAAKNLLTNDPYLRDFALLNKKINNLGQKIHLE